MAASSCQMLLFLHLAAKARIDVVEYEDDGQRRSCRSTRSPCASPRSRCGRASWSPATPARSACGSSCDTAHEHCYIANSLNSEMTLEPHRVGGHARERRPPVLERLLTTPGAPGQEGAAVAVWREAAEEFADAVTRGRDGHTRGARRRPRRAPAARGGRPHRRDRGARQPRDEGGLLHMVVSSGGWDPQILVGQRVEVLTPNGPVPGVGRAQADPPARARGAQEGGRAEGAARRHRREGPRRGRSSSCARATRS